MFRTTSVRQRCLRGHSSSMCVSVLLCQKEKSKIGGSPPPYPAETTEAVNVSPPAEAARPLWANHMWPYAGFVSDGCVLVICVTSSAQIWCWETLSDQVVVDVCCYTGMFLVCFLLFFFKHMTEKFKFCQSWCVCVVKCHKEWGKYLAGKYNWLLLQLIYRCVKICNLRACRWFWEAPTLDF